MSIFAGICIGIVIGTFLGGVGMFLLIKETALDTALEREADETVKFTDSVCFIEIDTNKREIQRNNDPAPELDLEDRLEMPQEVNYGDF